jgi:light-independent protochlorophyllide reductase subunit B
LFDSWVHPLMMGLEEHLITMFREDFEFSADAAPSHLGHTAAPRLPAEIIRAATPEPAAVAAPAPAGGVQVLEAVRWAADAEKELGKIPFFVRGKVRRNTEKFAAERGLATVTLDTLYDAKAHYAR